MRKPDITKYERGTNERLDAILDQDMEVWIINGPSGRRPVSAGSEEEALEKYGWFATKKNTG